MIDQHLEALNSTDKFLVLTADPSDNIREYCELHGYTYRSVKPTFDRMKVIEQELATGNHDYALWLDSGCYISKKHVPLSVITTQYPLKNVYMGDKILLVKNTPNKLDENYGKLDKTVTDLFNGSPVTLNTSKYLVILTCTVNTPDHIATLKLKDPTERLNIYQKSLACWNKISNDNFQVAVIENSAFDFPVKEPHIKYLSADTSDIPATSKGQHELKSIKHALDSIDLTKYDYVVKVTGRYFVPDLEYHLRSAQGYSGIRQNNRRRCEIVGCEISKCRDIFKYPSSKNYVELEYLNRMHQLKNVYALPPMRISHTVNGGHRVTVRDL